jgi:tRNA pseudouridine32 synthase/23S rRNA pseudouridine746 synthase/23S rRNA pseudouridine955/2504/2580 synthase
VEPGGGGLSGLRVLFRSDALIAVDKPAGALVIPGRQADRGPSLREQLEASLGQKVFVVHRLDRDTSGVLLFALSEAAHRAVSLAFERGEVEKRYDALVTGDLAAACEVDAALRPARRGRMRVAEGGDPEAKPAKTRFVPKERFGRATWVEAAPLTGRTHQIRVHLLSLGHPLLVDPQYTRPEPMTAQAFGGEGTEVVLARTPLHAARLTLPALAGMPAQTFEAPLPEDMSRALALLRGP